jgi:hypothetical protein
LNDRQSQKSPRLSTPACLTSIVILGVRGGGGARARYGGGSPG